MPEQAKQEISSVEWFYAQVGRGQQGPVSFEELKRFVADRQLKELDLVWNKDLPDWIPVRDVDGLLSQSSSRSDEVYLKRDESPRDRTLRRFQVDSQPHSKSEGFASQVLAKDFTPTPDPTWSEGIGTGPGDDKSLAGSNQFASSIVDEPQATKIPERSPDISNATLDLAQGAYQSARFATLVLAAGSFFGLVFLIPMVFKIMGPAASENDLVALLVTIAIAAGSTALAVVCFRLQYALNSLVRIPARQNVDRVYKSLRGLLITVGCLALLWVVAAIFVVGTLFLNI